MQPHVILTRSTPVTAAFLEQTRTIPIVFTVVSRPRRRTLRRSLGTSGGNATGFTNVEFSLTGKWVGLLKEIAPGIKRVAFIFDPKLAPAAAALVSLIEASAASFAVVPTVAPVHGTVEIERAAWSASECPFVAKGWVIAEVARRPNPRRVVASVDTPPPGNGRIVPRSVDTRFRSAMRCDNVLPSSDRSG